MRACTSSNRRTFSIAITAWSAKVWTSSICARVNGRARCATSTRTPLDLVVAQQRHAEQGARLPLRDVPRHIPGPRATSGTCARPCPTARRARRWRPGRAFDGCGEQELANSLWMPESRDNGILALAHDRSAASRAAQSSPPTTISVSSTGLQIERRPADDLQHVGGRGLVLQRLGEVAVLALHLVEQPRVLDGDRRLVGESLDELDLALA